MIYPLRSSKPQDLQSPSPDYRLLWIKKAAQGGAQARGGLSSPQRSAPCVLYDRVAQALIQDPSWRSNLKNLPTAFFSVFPSLKFTNLPRFVARQNSPDGLATRPRRGRKLARLGFKSNLFIKLVVMVNVPVLLWITWFTREKSAVYEKDKALGKVCMSP